MNVILVKLLLKQLANKNSNIYTISMSEKNNTDSIDWFDLKYYKDGKQIERDEINNVTVYNIVKRIIQALETIEMLNDVNPELGYKREITTIQKVCNKIVNQYISGTSKLVIDGNEYAMNLLNDNTTKFHKFEQLKTAMCCRQVGNNMEILIGDFHSKSVTVPMNIFNELFIVCV